MRALSSLGIGLTLVSIFLFLALMAELYYLFFYKNRSPRTTMSDTNSSTSSSRELLHLFCFKKPTSLTSQIHTNAMEAAAADEQGLEQEQESCDSVEAQLMRLHSLSGPARLLFTIKEETTEDLESEDARSRRGRSLGDLLHCSDTPSFLTPLSSPPVLGSSSMNCSGASCYKKLGFNPLFETASPPPKFKFLKDAEEKLYRRALMEEALRSQRNASPTSMAAAGGEEEEGSCITIVVGKNWERGHHHHLGSSQVIPLPSSPKLQGVNSS